MNILTQQIGHRLAILGVLFALLFAVSSQAAIDGVSGANFNIAVKPAIIPTPDGDSLLIWGYSVNGGVAQYPGPTLILNQGDSITINLTNALGVEASPGVPMPVSMVFPGQEGVSASGGSAGALTQESTGPADTVTYTFTARHAGTYQYYSGTRPELQIEMGLVGAIIVRPAAANQAYNDPGTAYDHEYLFLESEMAPEIHYLASLGLFDLIEQRQNTFNRVLWFFNGRNGPDTMADPGVSWLPNQPYNCLPRTHVGEKVLLRVIGAGQDMHPLHTHGNNLTIIAQDGRLLQSAPGNGPDLGRSDYTIQTVPGSTYDAIWSWTGEQLGWDIFGHKKNDPLEPGEYSPCLGFRT